MFDLISPRSPVGLRMMEAARSQRMIFYAGLPGVGKSLFVQQQVKMAARAGRAVHLLQWDVARKPFETEATLTRFPEIDGVTHPVIRKAVGIWVREALAAWHEGHPGEADLLVGELPVLGGRLSELVEPRDDAAEALLGGATATFFVPVPTGHVRREIEAKRTRTLAKPDHARERRDAPLDVVRENWLLLHRMAVDMGLASPRQEPEYDPNAYRRVFEQLLRHRRASVLSVDEVLPVRGSVYDLSIDTEELRAGPDAVARALAAASGGPIEERPGRSAVRG